MAVGVSGFRWIQLESVTVAQQEGKKTASSVLAITTMWTANHVAVKWSVNVLGGSWHGHLLKVR